MTVRSRISTKTASNDVLPEIYSKRERDSVYGPESVSNRDRGFGVIFLLEAREKQRSQIKRDFEGIEIESKEYCRVSAGTYDFQSICCRTVRERESYLNGNR